MPIFKWLDREGVKSGVRWGLSLLRNGRVNLALKVFLVAVVVYAIYQQVFAKDDIAVYWAAFRGRISSAYLPWLLAAILLMPVNWILETLKWQVLIRRVERIPFWKAYKGVFLGISFSIFTPNRIGEYGGRILVVKAANNWKTVVATLVGSFSQQIALLSLGTVGFAYFLLHHLLEADGWIAGIIILLGAGLVTALFLGYYNVHLAIPLFRRIPYLRRFTEDMAVLEEYSNGELTEALLYAVLRYLVYSLQYYLMLRFFGIEVSLVPGLAGISSIFLLQTSIPLPAIMDLVVRSRVALEIWGQFSDNDISILASTFGLWFLNIIVPATLGLVFILSVNITGSLGVPLDEEEEEESQKVKM